MRFLRLQPNPRRTSSGSCPGGAPVGVPVSASFTQSMTGTRSGIAGLLTANCRLLIGGGAGAALDFDGIDDHLVCGNSPSLDPQGTAMTIAAWIKTTGHGAIVSKRDNTTNALDYHVDPAGGRMRLGCGNNGGFAIAETNVLATLNDGEWRHVAWVVDSTVPTPSDRIKVYLDGTRITSMSVYGAPSQGGIIPSSGATLGIGARHVATTAEAFFTGTIDDVRIWRSGRTQNQIQTDMWVRPVGSEPTLVAYWRLDEGSGQAAGDSAPSANDGVLGTSTGTDSSDPLWVASTAPMMPAVADIATNALDGEFTGSLPSGDGTPGGDFVCTFEITAPTVTITSPADNATGVPVGVTIDVTFSRAMNQPATEAAILVSRGVTGTVSWTGNTLILAPDQPLDYSTYYTVTITTGAVDEDSIPLAEPYSFAFTTAAEPQPSGDDSGCAAGGHDSPLTLLAPFALIALALTRLRSRARREGFMPA